MIGTAPPSLFSNVNLAYFGLPRPRVFGHRGAAGLAPENTLPSFALATALNAGYLELDVRGTRDGTVVVLHDPTVDRTTDGEGAVADLPFAALEQLDAGYQFTYDGRHFPYRGQGVRIPRLESVLRAFPGHRINIEIKQARPPIVDAVLAIVRRAHATDRVLLAAEHDEIMHAIRAAAGAGVATGMSTGDVVDFITRCREDRWQSYRPPGQALQVPPAYGGIELITQDTLAAAHRFGIEVHTWTINDPDEIERLLTLGVDGIMSDLPGLAATIVARRSR
jgi:glycerophosphoryl diester phosphodiesterase